MVCEGHFKSGKISVIIFLGPVLIKLHFRFMNDLCGKSRVTASMTHNNAASLFRKITLCLTKYFSEKLQKLPHFWNMTTYYIVLYFGIILFLYLNA